MYGHFSKALFDALNHYFDRMWHRSLGNERLLISGYSEVTLSELFEQILDSCTKTRNFVVEENGTKHSYLMRTWYLPKPGIEVLPYFINPRYDRARPTRSSPADWAPNAGTGNFAGTLRDHYKSAFPPPNTADTTPILLVVDCSPAETLVETLGSALYPLVSIGRPLYKKNVLTQAVVAQHGAELAGKIVGMLVPAWRETWGEFSESDQEAVYQLLGKCRPHKLIEDFGAGMSELDGLLADPELTPQNIETERIRQNRDLVIELQDVLGPQDDPEEYIRTKYDSQTAAAILDAVRGGQIDTGFLTFQQLLDGQRSKGISKIKLTLVRDQVIVAYKKNQTYVIPVKPTTEKLHFTVRASDTLSNMHVDIKDKYPRDLPVSPLARIGEKDINFSVSAAALHPEVPTMISLGLYRSQRARKKLSELIVILIPSQSGDVVFEGSLELDIAEGAFVVPSTNEARLYYMDPSGTVKSPSSDFPIPFGVISESPAPFTVIIPSSASDHYDVTEITLPLKEGIQRLRVYAHQEEDKTEPAESFGSVPQALLRIVGSLSDNEELDAGMLLEPVHLMAADQMVVAGQQFSISAEVASWLQLEGSTAAESGTVSWSLKKHGNDYDFTSLEKGLQQEDWGSAPAYFEPVRKARTKLLQAVIDASKGSAFPGGSILLLDLRADEQRIKDVVESAKGYIKIYSKVLGELIGAGSLFKDADNWLLFTDTVFVYDESDELVEINRLPYHPLNLAHMIGLYKTVGQWLGAAGADPKYIRFAAKEPDPKRFSPASLVPALKYANAWYTIAEQPDSLYSYWPRYIREDLRQDQPGAYQGRMIREKMQQFLDTYPMLMKPEGKVSLRLNFINPGSGYQIVNALGDFYKRHSDDTPTMIHLTLISDDPHAGSALDLLFAASAGKQHDHLETIRQNVTYGKTDKKQQPPYAHITFVTSLYEIEHDRPDRIDRFPDSLLHGGLIPAPSRYLVQDEGDVYFRYKTHTWISSRITTHHSEWQHWLKDLSRDLQCLASYYGGKKIQPGYAAVRTVSIHPNELRALYHENSLWVVHLDREIGLELFQKAHNNDDHGTKPFIIDYSDQYDPDVEGYDAITTTAHLLPYIEAVRAIFGNIESEVAQRTIETLNLLSGRWALRLVNATDTNVRGRLGNVLAFEYLQKEEGAVGLSEDHQSLKLVLSLEEFLRLTPATGLPVYEGLYGRIGNEESGGSDDLFLVTLHRPDENGNVAVQGRIVEVKYGTSDVLKGATQVMKTFNAMSKIFGPPQRSDWLLRATDLASFIHAHIDRYVNYGLIAVEELRNFGYYDEVYPALNRGQFEIHFTYPDPATAQELVGDVIHINPGTNYFRSKIAVGTQVRILSLPEPWWRQILSSNEKPASIHSFAASMTTDVDSGDSILQPGQGEEPPDSVAVDRKTADAGSRDEDAESGRQPIKSTLGSPEELPSTRTTSMITPLSRAQQLARILSGTVATTATPEIAGADLEDMADHLGQSLRAYGIKARQVNMAEIEMSASIVRFKVILEPGETLAKVQRHAPDLARELAAVGDLSISNIPGTPYIGIDVPRQKRGTVTLGNLLQTPEIEASFAEDKLIIPLGEGLGGTIGFFNLVDLPHLLVAGSTGSGKTVFLYNVILSLSVAHGPESLQLLLIDPKRVDFALFQNLPHLWGGHIIHDPEQAIAVLEDTVLVEIKRRQTILEMAGQVNLGDYNEQVIPEKRLPRIVIIIDEFSHLTTALDSSNRKTFEERVQRIAQIGRALGVHLVLATQRPSTDVITGTIRANIPGRISFRLPSHHDSGTVLDEPGAETLLGKGDLLFKWEGTTLRYQAPFITTSGVNAAVQLISQMWPKRSSV